MSGSLTASAVVLAGGRSDRFGAQKLAFMLDGAPLLHHTLAAVVPICDEVLVVGPAGGLPVRLPDGLGSTVISILDERPFEGPLVALVYAARCASRQRLLIVAGDMPDLQPAVLRRLLTFGGNHEGACLVAGGIPQPLPMAMLRDVALGRGADLIAAGERSLRGVVASLDIEAIAEPEWRKLDPDGRSLRDIDRPADLVDHTGGLRASLEG
jgi:molybdopterin-guanine dinucleotide biosynthesis protein A